MIPIRLKIKGFLSYQDPVEVDFSSFELACISGQNGAGKSSLLDAITWVIFGQARKRDDALINSSSDGAEVSLIFEYEQNIYRIQRIMQRGKTGLLEFQIFNGEGYRALSESSTRATQAKIEETLRLDYDTFVNASFFLQGKADQFTQQKPSERKRILSTILGLEIWETYKERTADRRKLIEDEQNTTNGRISEINLELAEEPARLARLKELESEQKRLADTRLVQELLLANSQQAQANLKRQQEQVEKVSGQIKRGAEELDNIQVRMNSRRQERDAYLVVVAKAETVEAASQAWQTAREQLEKWDRLADTFRERERERHAPLAKIAAEEARLGQEQTLLQHREQETQLDLQEANQIESELAGVRKTLSGLDEQLKRRSQLEQSQAIISRFREQAGLRQAPLSDIQTEQARLEQEQKTLEKQLGTVETQRTALTKLGVELSEALEKLTITENQLSELKEFEGQIQSKKELVSVLKNTNDRLKIEMDALNDRIIKLEGTEGAVCPLCGQPLNPAERKNLIASLKTDGKERGNEFRKNKSDLENLTGEMNSLAGKITGMPQIERNRLFHVSARSSIEERIKANQQAISDWESKDAKRLVQIVDTLKAETFCQPARQNLARIDRELEAIGKALNVKASAGQSIFERVEDKVREIEQELTTFKSLEEERLQFSSKAAQLAQQLDTLRNSIEDWNKNGNQRLAEIDMLLANGNYALADRQQLAAIDQRLKELGYDASAHDTVRKTELDGRASEEGMRKLQAARSALIPLERELEDIQAQAARIQADLDGFRNTYAADQQSLEKMQIELPDLRSAERALLEARERENILTREVGAAQQKVKVLADLRNRKAGLEIQREEQAVQIKNHKTLERAFSKDGVPALLIEQALPQIEEKANELLDRLSNSTMSVRFVTQARFKDNRREDLRETLEIQISDGAGTRDYEMFSGGEAFRVNFAIRLALSEILARRTGARLQTLVIDEGFGSQDSQGRQRLIEAINQVKVDFAKILIITHLEELKEAFPNRIEVEKTARGSIVRVM